MLKTCTRCKKDLEPTEFGKNKRQKSGLSPHCKDCQKIANSKFDFKGWYQTNKSVVIARVYEYRKARPEQEKKYRQKRAGKQQKYNAEWRSANPDRVAELKRLWKARNVEHVRKLKAESRSRNLHSRSAKEARRRTASKRGQPAWANVFFIREAYHLARLRTEITGFPWQVDHIVPLRSELVCGLHVENNLAVIPAVTNIGKSNRHWPDMP